MSNLREYWKQLNPEERQRYTAELPEKEAEQFWHSWEVWARDNQLAPPGDWTGWLLLAGRGFGKTRTAGEWIRQIVATGNYGRIGIVARTAADLRDVVVDGESGILSIYPKSERPNYEPSKRRVTFANGAIASLYSAEEPDTLRGPQHHAMWFDELAAYQYQDDVFDQAMFGLRLGKHPRWAATTTPRPTKLIKRLVEDKTVAVTRGNTYDNADNLAPTFISTILARYEGTRLGRQEINGEILDDNPNSLWSRADIDNNRVAFAPTLARICVAVDPAVSTNATSNNTGIVAVGMGMDGDFYVLSDDTLSAAKPTEWGQQVVAVYSKYHANMIVGEVNQGGDLVESNVRACGGEYVPFEAVRASKGKATRAEPVSSLYEQGRVHHVGTLPELEDELCGWDPTLNETSPDRLDALVWGMTWLMEKGGAIPMQFKSTGRRVFEDTLSNSNNKDKGVGFGSVSGRTDFYGY